MAHDKDAHLDTSTAVPGGELGGTWASPTIDATHSGSAHHAQSHGDADHTAAVKTIRIRKTADETVSLSNTSQDDDHLFFSIAANEVWVLSFSIVFQSTTVGDFKYHLGAPTGATGHIQRSDLSSTSGVTALNTDSASVAGTTGSDINLPLLAIVANGSTAGTVQFKWASFTVDVDTTVRANSFLIAHRLA